jgi:hypothetical protein
MNLPGRTLYLFLAGAFLAGLALGAILFSNPGSPLAPSGTITAGNLPANSAAPNLHPLPGTTASTDASGSAESLTGEKLISRLWVALTNPNEDERYTEWMQLLKNMSKEDGVKIREMFLKMDREGRRFTPEWLAFWPRWGAVDGPGALEFLKTHEHPSWRNDAAEMLVRGWAAADPAAARRWLEENRNSPFFEGAERGYFDGLARTNLSLATQEAIADATGDSKRMLKVMERLSEQALQQRSLDGMVEWWNGLPGDGIPGTAKREAVGHVWWRLQFADPDKAAAWLAHEAGGILRSDFHIQEQANRYMESDPAKAMTWLSSLPASSETELYTGIGTTLRRWAGKDSAAVEQWLAAQPAGPARDQAYTAYGYYLQSQDSPASQQWLDAVQDKSWLTRQYPHGLRLSQGQDGSLIRKEQILVP